MLLFSNQTTNGLPRITFPKKSFVPRQSSPVLVRHVLTTDGALRIADRALLSSDNATGLPTQSSTLQSKGSFQHIVSSDSSSSPLSTQSGQYILVQRTGIVASDAQSTPRASSAPPAQNQVSHDCGREIELILKTNLSC